MAAFTNFKINWETRLCKVKDRYGYFHTWEQYSEPVGESLVVGGPPAGVIARLFGIVEFEDGVERVNPYNIQFCDQTHAELKDFCEYMKEKENDYA
jgi:hypothetical protein